MNIHSLRQSIRPWLPILLLSAVTRATGADAAATPPALERSRIEFVVRQVAGEVLRTTHYELSALAPGAQPSRYNEWLYQNFIIGEAMTALGAIWGDEAYRTYARRVVDFYSAWEPTVTAEPLPKQLTWFRAPTEMWHCGLIAAFADQQRTHPSPAKLRGMAIFDRFLTGAPRLPDGTIVRYKKAPWDSPGLQIGPSRTRQVLTLDKPLSFRGPTNPLRPLKTVPQLSTALFLPTHEPNPRSLVLTCSCSSIPSISWPERISMRNLIGQLPPCAAQQTRAPRRASMPRCFDREVVYAKRDHPRIVRPCPPPRKGR